MKRLDTMTKEELWEQRRLKALERGDEDLSGEYGDEINNSAAGPGTKASGDDMLGPRSRRRLLNKGKVAPDGSTLDPTSEMNLPHPPCPEGFDPDKWDKMSLEEKCKYLGIDM